MRARNLTLDQGQITAEAAVAPAGDIQLNIDNFLLLRNGSLISTTAGGDATGAISILMLNSLLLFHLRIVILRRMLLVVQGKYHYYDSRCFRPRGPKHPYECQ